MDSNVFREQTFFAFLRLSEIECKGSYHLHITTSVSSPY